MNENELTDLIELDGAQGEGGGQVLRTSLTLSAISGRAFRIVNIRAGRARPGLLRQHLTAVQAVAESCGAQVSGAVPGSRELSFRPGAIRGGDYRLAIGTAGSCTLVLQTLLPVLWFADVPSTVQVSGGTHNPSAPPADFLIRAWAPLMARMGVKQRLTLSRHGFYPAGGGVMHAEVQPCAGLLPLRLEARGVRVALRAEARVAGLPDSVAEREMLHLRQCCAGLDGLAGLEGADMRIDRLPKVQGPGNVLLLEAEHAEVVEIFTGFGLRGVRAETVAETTAAALAAYLNSGAAVGEYLADQLLLPMALAGGGALTCSALSSHLRTNAAVIQRFLPVRIDLAQSGGMGVLRVA